MTIQTVHSKDDLCGAIEAAFGASGLVDHLSPLLQQTKKSFDETVLARLPYHGDSLPDNWLGNEGQSDTYLPPGTTLPEVRQAFAEDIGKYLTHGESVQKRLFMGYKIEFPDLISAGTGDAAAKLVAATLAEQGIDSKLSGTTITFKLDSKEHKAAMDAFIANCKALDRERSLYVSGMRET